MAAVKKHQIGYIIPDLPDRRDKLFKLEVPRVLRLPKRVDLRSEMSPVEDQGQLGSCTANAFAGNLEYLWKKKKKFIDASRLFIYYNERLYINSTGRDSGANLRDGIKALKKYGVCSETTWPYRISKFKIKPPAPAYKEGLDRTIEQYLRVLSIADIKQSLAQKLPVNFGISVYDSFQSPKANKTGIIPDPKKGESVEGGHAMLFVGYDDNDKHFIVRNSWSKYWGDKGYCYISYDYVDKDASDMWTIIA
jgi:C1A family cysteine protease